MAGGEAVLSVEGLWVRLGGRWVLRGVSMTARGGVVTGVIGPNGAGKTTLLKTVAGLVKPSRGRVAVIGRPVERYGRREYARLVALPLLAPAQGFRLTVSEALRVTLSGLGLAYDEALVEEVARGLGIAGLLGRRLDTLSSGELQLVNIAAGLVRRPRLLLLDEPTSHLDVRRRVEAMEAVKRYAAEEGAAVVAVMHDLKTAADYADEVVVLREGRVLARGPVDEVFRDEVLSEAYGARIRVVRLEELGLVPVVLRG